nr:hypothetical protein [Mesorhizobium sp.]
MSASVAGGRPTPLAVSSAAASSTTIPDFFRPVKAVETVERAKPVSRAICAAEMAPRWLRQRTIRLSGVPGGWPSSSDLSRLFVIFVLKLLDCRSYLIILEKTRDLLRSAGGLDETVVMNRAEIKWE